MFSFFLPSLCAVVEVLSESVPANVNDATPLRRAVWVGVALVHSAARCFCLVRPSRQAIPTKTVCTFVCTCRGEGGNVGCGRLDSQELALGVTLTAVFWFCLWMLLKVKDVVLVSFRAPDLK